MTYNGPYKGHLTPENHKLLQETITTRMAQALSTERSDRPAAEAAVRELYAANNLAAPAFIWMDSPIGGIFALSTLKTIVKGFKEGGQLRGQLWRQLWDQLGGQLRGQLWRQLGGQLWDQLRGQLWGQLGDQLRGQLWGQLGDQLGDQLRGQLWDQLWGQLRDQLRDQLKEDYNAYYNGFTSWYETYWTAFYAKAFEIAQIHAPDLERKLGLFTTVMDNTGWWYATPAVAFMTERPTKILRDAQGRLHNPKGMALEYADGYGFNAWHGTRLPDDFHARDWTLEAVMKETNAEVRRCAIEATGWDKFIAESGMEPVGKPVPDPGNAPFELALYDLPEALNGLYREPARVLLCTNGTLERDGSRRRYGLIVPARHKDPVAAAADLYGVDRDTYAALEVRR